MADYGSHEVKVHFVEGHSEIGNDFSALSQLDADYALAKALQEQERAYILARVKNTSIDCEQYDGSESSSSAFAGNWDVKSQLQLKRDEAFAQALQDADDQEQLMIMLSLAGVEDSSRVHHDQRNNTQDDVDPDSMSYEDLLALSEAMGSQYKGLTPEEIAMLPVNKYKKCCLRNNKDERCVICFEDYERGVSMITLPCKHSYHADCIKRWLENSKACPVCAAEVSVTKGKKTG